MIQAMAEPHRLEVRVYYEDTDFSGVVYHANYLRFFERGRTEFLRARGVLQADLRDEARGQPLAFAVRHMTIDFLKSARMDDLLSVETAVSAMGGASITIAQRLVRGDDLLVLADVRIGLVSGGKAQRFPATLRACLG